MSVGRANPKLDCLARFVDANRRQKMAAIGERVERVGAQIRGRFLDVKAEVSELGAQARDERLTIWIRDDGNAAIQLDRRVTRIRAPYTAWSGRLCVDRIRALRADTYRDDQPSAAQQP